VPYLNLKKVLRNQDPAKFKSKDLMDHSGDKCADLHKLASKIDYVKPRVDRSPHDVDYDKNKSECYFKPKLRQSTWTLAESAASGAGGSQSNFGIVSGKKKSSKVTHSMSTINFS